MHYLPEAPRAPAGLVRNLLTWFTQNARDLPWRRTRDPYAIWVSEIMLQQTQVKTVLPYWEHWMKAIPSTEALARAPLDRLYKLWEGLGYYHRVRNMQAAARLIQTEHNGKFPDQLEDLLELSGIGRYTAGAICSIAFNQPQPVLDGNVIRVLTRLFAVDGDPRKPQTSAKLWKLATELAQQAFTLERGNAGHGRVNDFNGLAAGACSALSQSLMELGATVCTPRQPVCGQCPMQRRCIAYRTRRVQELPALGNRVRATPRRFFAFVVSRRGRFLVRQRPEGVVNARLWEFPNTEVTLAETDYKKNARAALGFDPGPLKPLGSLKHTITRYRITVDVFGTDLRNGATGKPVDGRWFNPAHLSSLAFASAHGKILRQFADL
jgi:A/G-specific adenine glycosylase